jgi:hypothetical protein
MAKRGDLSENLRSSLEPSYDKPDLPHSSHSSSAHASHAYTHTSQTQAHNHSHPAHSAHQTSHTHSSEKQTQAERPTFGGTLGKFMTAPSKEVISEKTTVHTEHSNNTHNDEHRRAVHHAHHRRKRFEVFAAFFLAALLAVTFMISMSADANPFIVLFSFTPTLFTVVIAMIVYEAHKDNKNILWVLPLIFTFSFHWLASNAQGSLGSVNVEVLTAMNIFFSFFYLIVNYFLLQSPAPKMKSGDVKVVVKEREVIPEDLTKFIASIEDKGKALNFAIGRVYNAYHGGTKELRQKINIKQEWYDEFSQIPNDPKELDFVSLSALISTIEARLRLLEKSEVEIFGGEHKKFKNLVRSEDGSDSVLEILDKNDKDPVKSYVEGALEFCGKVKDYLSKNKAPEVKNEYVERPDEDKRKTSAPRSSTWNKLK